MKPKSTVAPNADQGAISHFFNNLDLILTNQSKILSADQFSNIKIPGMYFAGLHVRMHQFCIGEMIKLWDETEWHTDSKYYYCIVGSPLSGNNVSFWFDSNTRAFDSGLYHNGKWGFLGLVQPAAKCLHKYPFHGPESKLSVFDLVKQLQK